MILSAPFIVRPVATTLLSLAVVLAGSLAFRLLAVAPLPEVDIPTISVTASLPGASPETMASSVATPLERALGAIAGVTEMTSSSTQGSTRITLQFDLSRDIDGAARDVQAAINASRTLLPSGLKSNPTYRKANPSAAPIMTLALTSDTHTQGELYDLASTIVAQKLSQVNGVGDVTVGGSSLPAVRVEVLPGALTSRGVSLDEVRTALSNANANRPKGFIDSGQYQWTIMASDQLSKAAQYRPLIVAWRDGAPVRLSDVATVEDSVEDLFQTGFYNERKAILLIVRREAAANIIQVVDSLREELPRLQAQMPGGVQLAVAQDRSPSIRASLHEAEMTLIIAVGLVMVVVLLFLRRLRAALIPCVAVPVSLIGTFSIMYLCGYTLNTISLMALIVATGFVVDDAIVVLENIMRYIERGMSPVRAAMRGAREVGFTVLSMSLSLVAVFIPILLMGGVVGRFFREFAVTLSAAILVSLVTSLTLTPMMCGRMLRARDDEPPPERRPGLFSRLGQWSERGFQRLSDGYSRSLRWTLNHGPLVMVVLLLTVCLNVYLYIIVPKGFFPNQDTGQLLGFFRVDQGTSFQATVPKLEYMRKIVLSDPAVQSMTGYAGGRGGSNSSFMQIQLKPLAQRGVSAEVVIERLRGRLQSIPGARMFLVAQQDIRIGGRASSTGSYDYALMASDLSMLRTWMPRVQQALARLPELVDVDTDVEDKGQQVNLVIDREAATRLGVSMSDISAVLNNSFSQRQVSVMYGPLNQYHVILGVPQSFARDAQSLRNVDVVSASGARVPLASFASFEVGSAPLSVQHQGLFVADTISFSLAPGVSLGQASDAVDAAVARIGLPTDQIQASFQGTAAAAQQTLQQQPWLILAALVTMYIVLGILYESFVHPFTILSTLPSAGIGALLALMLMRSQFTVIALIGVFLLIGIVKKNAIMMVDFALAAERGRGLAPREAIFEACVTRFRPIMMTTLAAIMGAIPLVLATGTGAELRQPLGITIVGGLFVSQVLTLYTTPVVYLYLDRLRHWARRRRAARAVAPSTDYS
ncbi:multidrug efflux RND transporter permease subunit [Bordetella genomosp. 11]|uniref:Multidrug transporter subunit MdtC n=1 Tax=Bordetella genomosp. 11 TaxID=1416808 RepID=A0A261UMM8_9BORD|nr:multidrug efflux RND transporter permease subunit [Bordetella genomosp. 11]OZI62540.1 multidrug transporter subunit MdtC [Bordetella genomosp. 11]